MEENKITTNGNLYIPNETVLEIMKRVPAKSLMRFKCISKYFCSLISEPSFIEAHHKSFVSQFLLSHVNSTEKEVVYNLSEREEYQDLACPIEYLEEPCFRILPYMQSINGLICLWNWDGDIAICNPFTKQHIFPPRMMIHSSIFTYSFGFDPTTKKHKILMSDITITGIDQEKLVAKYWIFTIGVDKRWREISNWTEIIAMNNCVCIDGVIYLEHVYGDYIAAFSIVGNEKLIRTITFPSLIRTRRPKPIIGEIKGELALLIYGTRILGTDRILLYVLNGTSETETWLKHTVELPPELIKTSSRPLFTINHKGEIVSISDTGISHMFLYDTGKKEWRKIKIHRIYEREYRTIRANSGLLNLVESIWSLR